MFEICMIIGWAAAMILLLYIRADIRELSGLLKENRREMIRNSIGGRSSESYPNFQEEARRRRKSVREEVKEQPPEQEKQPLCLNESEEQILKEVLTEFLG